MFFFGKLNFRSILVISHSSSSSCGSRISQTGAPTPKRWAPTYYLANFFIKTASKLKKLDWGGGKKCQWSGNSQADATDLSMRRFVHNDDYHYLGLGLRNSPPGDPMMNLCEVRSSISVYTLPPTLCLLQSSGGTPWSLHLFKPSSTLQQALYVPNSLCLQWRIQDFPEEGAPTPQGGGEHTILPYFPKNCMKIRHWSV